MGLGPHSRDFGNTKHKDFPWSTWGHVEEIKLLCSCLKSCPNGSIEGTIEPSKENIWDFPGGPVVKNPPSNSGDAGPVPGQGTKIPHAVGQLSPCTTTTELVGVN